MNVNERTKEQTNANQSIFFWSLRSLSKIDCREMRMRW